MINYSDTKFTVKQYERHLFDGIRLYVTTPTGKQTAVLAITTSFGDTFTETHALNDGKTIFDISEYLRESMPIDWRRVTYAHNGTYLPIAAYNSKSNLVANAVRPTNAVKSLTITIGDDVIDLSDAGLEVYYGYTKFEPSERLHLFNPNFECVAEYMPTISHISTEDLTGFTLFGLCFNRNNDGEIDWYKHPFGSVGTVRQVRLNDYWDERYNDDGIMLDFVTNETATETTSYIVDTRTTGAYLRFMDSEGFMQQMLLDIESQESTYEDGDLITYYDGDVRHFELNDNAGAYICNGHGKTAKRTETNCLHCSVTNLPIGLVSDLKAIMLSPVVLLYRGKDDDGNMKWERVRISATNGSITKDNKKATISAKIDIYPSFENSYI